MCYDEFKVKRMKQDELNIQYENKKEVTKGGILGFFIGIAIIVPGISGSTKAIIFKLYDKLLYALGNIVKHFKLCFLFLIPIAIGAILGFLLGFFTIQNLLNYFPFAVTALFGGLMIGAFPALFEEIKHQKKTLSRIILFILGFILPLGISISSIYRKSGNQSLENLQLYHYFLFVLLGYLVAITQIVPGLSATALLMSFGYFTPLMEAVTLSYLSSHPTVIFVFICLILGMLLGMITFSSFMTKVFSKNRIPAFFMIIGLASSSILTVFINPEIIETYISWNQGNISFGFELFLGILLFFCGCYIAHLFLKYEQRKKY